MHVEAQWNLVHASISNTGVAFDENDNMYIIGQGDGLFLIENGTSVSLSDAPVNSDLTSFQINVDDIWVGGYGGGGKYNNGTWENFQAGTDIEGSAIYATSSKGNSTWLAMEMNCNLFLMT